MSKTTVYDDPRNTERPPPAPVNGPHWIVIRTSQDRQVPGKHSFRELYRHATQEGAFAEAQRLSDMLRGRLFIVYQPCMAFTTPKDGQNLPAGFMPHSERASLVAQVVPAEIIENPDGTRTLKREGQPDVNLAPIGVVGDAAALEATSTENE
jgi:hypothetical protein